MTLSGPLNTPFDVDVQLDANPNGDATVKFFPASPAGLTLSPTTLTFDETDWSTPKQLSATIKQNPIELGGSQNTQVVFTETTTSWGGPWNVTKDVFRLTVTDEPLMTVLPGSSYIGSSNVPSHLASVLADSTGANMKIKVRLLSGSSIRGFSVGGVNFALLSGSPSTANVFKFSTSSVDFTVPRDGTRYEVAISSAFATGLAEVGFSSSANVRVSVGIDNNPPVEITLSEIASCTYPLGRVFAERYILKVASYSDYIEETIAWAGTITTMVHTEFVGNGLERDYVGKSSPKATCSPGGSLSIYGNALLDGSGSYFNALGVVRTVYEGSLKPQLDSVLNPTTTGWPLQFNMDIQLE